ncbi:ArnT family glycosyltransferase [Lysobacter capsici]|uniref:ArnT family glycosyltransferase n=1 Tax=Lysobacter capsici TaxID=435897 RepID=UPI001C004BE8|nr:glycosyltransferase family 39 protein [Lysobacter capsici]QWF16147.1 glycosyltransferase family 39 protein [Lysobacter capsici]
MISKMFAHLVKRGFGSVPLSLVFLALVAMAFLGLRAFNGDPRHSRAIMAQDVQLSGFAGVGRDGFRAVAGPAGHVISGKIKIRPSYRYAFSLKLQPADSDTASLTIDLFRPGYDNARQERSFVVYRSGTPVVLRESVDSGRHAPGEVEFRIFYGGEPGAVVRDIRISELPVWRVWAQSLLAALLAVAVAMFLLALGRWSTQSDSAQSTARGPLPTLTTLFLAVSILRFVASLLLPYWSGDEYIYKAIAAGLWAGGRDGIPSPDQVLHATNLPNMLYPYVIAPAFLFGENFYIGIRLFNALLMSSAVFPVFFIARRILGERASLLTAAFSVALPSVFIAAYAVTEVLYFPVFLWCALAGLRLLDRPEAWTRSVALGIAIGTLLNVRLNAIVVLPAVFIALFVIAWREPQRRNRFALLVPLLAPVVAFATYEAIKSLIAVPDTSGLGLYENRSGGWIRTAVSAAWADPAGVGKLLLGHLTILALPFALGISAAAGLLAARPRTEQGAALWLDTVLISVLCIASISLAIVFTLGTSPYDLGGLGRWHSRYYFSVFPLLLIMCMAPRNDCDQGAFSKWLGWISQFVLLGSVIAFVFVFKFSSDPWFGATVDSMEAHWYRMSHRWLLLVLCVGLLAFYVDTVRRSKVWAVVAIGLWLSLSNIGAWKILHDASPGGDDAHCGALAYQVMFRDPGTVAVVASSRDTLVDNVFWLPYLPETARMVQPKGELSAHELGKVRYILADSEVVVKDARLLPNTGVCRIYKVDANEL